MRRGRSGSRSATIAGICLALGLAGEAFGATWHVRPDGSNEACSGLQNAPDPGSGSLPRDCAFATPQKGVDASGPGDKVALHAGTYKDPGTSGPGFTGILTISIRPEFDSEENRLTIAAAGDGEVVFDGRRTLDTGIVILGTSYLTIEGISFRGFTAGPSLSETPSVLAFWGNFSAAAVNVRSPGPESPSSHLILKSLDVDQSSVSNASPYAAEIAIWCEDCTDNRIEGCRLSSNEDITIAIGGGDVDQRGVIAHNTIVRGREGTGIFGEGVRGWTIQENYFDDSPLDPFRWTAIRVAGGSHWTIAGNVIRHPGYTGIGLDRLTGVPETGAHAILNNTIDCSGGGIAVFSSCTDCQLRNNIVRNCTTAFMFMNDNSGTQVGYNALFENGTDYDATTYSGYGFATVGGDVSGDPLFRRVMPQPDPFYRLRPSSPAVGAGDPAHCAVDGDAACDIGAMQISIPTVAAADPSPGSDDVPVTVEPRITFNVPVAVTSLTPVSIKLLRMSRPRVEVPVSFAVEGAGATVRITPLGWIDANTQHRITVAGGPNGVLSRDGEDPGRSFGTGFTTESALARSDPPSGERAAPVTVTPTLTFKWPISPSSATSAVFQLKDVTSGKKILLSTVTLGADERTVMMSPATTLRPRHQYRITVAGGPYGLRYRTSPGTRSGNHATAPTGSPDEADGQLGGPIKVTFRTGS